MSFPFGADDRLMGQTVISGRRDSFLGIHKRLVNEIKFIALAKLCIRFRGRNM